MGRVNVELGTRETRVKRACVVQDTIRVKVMRIVVTTVRVQMEPKRVVNTTTRMYQKRCVVKIDVILNFKK